MSRPPGDRSRPVWIAALLIISMVVAGCTGKPKEEILMELAPVTPGMLTVATTLPAPGFWEGDDTRRSWVAGTNGVWRGRWPTSSTST